MKPQLKWFTAFFAIFLALCAMHQTTQAQTTEVLPVVRTYYISTIIEDSDNRKRTIVLRLHRRAQLGEGELTEVFGALTLTTPQSSQNPNGSAFIWAIRGNFDPDTGRLSGTLDVPPSINPSPATPVATITGLYDAGTDTFSLEFTFTPAPERSVSPPLKIVNVAGYTGPIPYMVGIWQWSAVGTASAAEPRFSGEFWIFEQSLTDGVFKGIFSKSNAFDVGVIFGQATSPDEILIRRTGTRPAPDNQPFEQLWWAKVRSDVTIPQGFIEQTVPGIWSGTWTARPFW